MSSPEAEDEVIERAADGDLSWWAPALECLRPTAQGVSDQPESDPDDQAERV